MDQQLHDALMKEYGEVSNNFRLLTDIRFKLLGLLPIVTAAAQAWKAEDLGAQRLALSVFGLAATIGLYLYNARNDQFYDSLIGRAAEIERTLTLPDGSFANRPKPWLSIGLGRLTREVDHRKAIETVYAASAALWLFGILAPSIDLARRAYLSIPDVPYLKLDPTPFVNLIGALLAILLTVVSVKSINKQRGKQESDLRRDAKKAVEQALSLKVGPAVHDPAFRKTCVELSGYDCEAIKARSDFYGSLDANSLAHYLPLGSERLAAAHLVALLTDLPPQRIFDWATGRRDEKRPNIEEPTSNPALQGTPLKRRP